jgi:hypothetical protein
MKKDSFESLNEEIELINFISRYSGGEVYTRIETTSPEVHEISQDIVLVSRKIDENGRRYKYSQKGGIDESLFNGYLLKHFEEVKTKHPGLKKTIFINGQIDFIARVSEELKRGYTYILNDLKVSFEKALAKLELETPRGTKIGNSTSIVKIPTLEIERIRKCLIEKKYLIEKGENSKVKPIIAALMSELAKMYKTTQSNVLKQIKPIFKLSSDKTKNYKISKSKRGEHNTIVTEILNS